MAQSPNTRGYHRGTIKLARRILNILTEAEKPLTINQIRERLAWSCNGIKNTMSFLISVKLVKKEYMTYIQKGKGKTKFQAKYWHYSLR